MGEAGAQGTRRIGEMAVIQGTGGGGVGIGATQWPVAPGVGWTSPPYAGYGYTQPAATGQQPYQQPAGQQQWGQTWGGGGGGGGGTPAAPAAPVTWAVPGQAGQYGWLPWQDWQQAPWANVPTERAQENQAWMNVVLPWMQQQAQQQQWGTEFDWRKAADIWNQQFQQEQFAHQQAQDVFGQDIQRQQLAEQGRQANVAAFGRRWAPNTRWM